MTPETEKMITKLAHRDRNQSQIREILLAVIETPELTAAMAHTSRTTIPNVKIAITNWLGIVADPKTGEAIRCPKNVDRFHGMNNKTMETYKCDLCGLEATPGLPAHLV